MTWLPIATIGIANTDLKAYLFKTDVRPSGRRFQVVTPTGIVCYDTDDCHDYGNAIHKLESWLASEEGALACRPKGG